MQDKKTKMYIYENKFIIIIIIYLFYFIIFYLMNAYMSMHKMYMHEYFHTVDIYK